jgi:hypothetical protein
MGEGEIESSENSEVEVRVEIRHLEGTRVGELGDYSAVKFDINVSMEEQERKGEQLIINFQLSITTNPNVAKFEVGGTATVIGTNRTIDSVLTANPETQVPPILHVIYQKVFTSLFILSSFLESPYPPPDLLYTSKGKRSAAIAEEKKQEEALKAEGQTVAQGSQQTEQPKQQ